MPEPDTTLDIDPEERAEQAFHDSESYEFRGVKLEPLSMVRETAIARLKLDLETASGLFYLVYLCLTPAHEVRKLRSEERIEAWMEKADAWADAQGISLVSDSGRELIGLAGRILNDRYAAEFQASKKGEAGPAGPK